MRKLITIVAFAVGSLFGFVMAPRAVAESPDRTVHALERMAWSLEKLEGEQLRVECKVGR